MADQNLDMIQRDPNSLNKHVGVDFDDVIGEPTGTHSIDCVWRCSYKCFTCSKKYCYIIMTFFCSIFIAIGWGCTYAGLSFYSIWCCTPYLRALHIMLHPIKKIYSIILGTFLAPLVEVSGLFFSRIHVTNSTGEPPKPLDALGKVNYVKDNVKNFK